MRCILKKANRRKAWNEPSLAIAGSIPLVTSRPSGHARTSRFRSGHSENQDYDGHSNEYKPIKDTFVGIAWLVNMERRWIIGGKRFATLGATRLGQAIETIAAVGTLRSGHGTDCNRTILIANATIEP